MFSRGCGLGVSTPGITTALHPNILWAALNVLLENGSVAGWLCHRSHMPHLSLLCAIPGSHQHPPDSEEVPAGAKATHSVSLYQQLFTSLWKFKGDLQRHRKDLGTQIHASRAGAAKQQRHLNRSLWEHTSFISQWRNFCYKTGLSASLLQQDFGSPAYP